ncbi:MAG: hypothetical protein ACI8WB_001169 [Phenylobacterium sp.]|jgi:hypothetical protein
MTPRRINIALMQMKPYRWPILLLIVVCFCISWFVFFRPQMNGQSSLLAHKPYLEQVLILLTMWSGGMILMVLLLGKLTLPLDKSASIFKRIPNFIRRMFEWFTAIFMSCWFTGISFGTAVLLGQGLEMLIFGR